PGARPGALTMNGASAMNADVETPSSTSEKYLAALWMEIIGLEQVKRPHRFLEVGGNSLTLNVILTRIEAETGAALDPQAFFDDDRPAIYLLARELDAKLAH